MKDDMNAWLPVAEHLKNLSIAGLETLRTMVDYELAERRAMFYSNISDQENTSEQQAVSNREPKLKVVSLKSISV